MVKTESNIVYICSRFYLPPELVIGATIYTTQVDVWPFGCFIAELVLNKPNSTGKKATDQLLQIMKFLGTQSPEEIKAMNEKFDPTRKIDDEQFFDLVANLLVYDPIKRFSPYQALNHPFF